jgi:isopentenyldiphosphate isomerase
MKSAVEWLVEQIENQQKFYIDLAKKDKTKRKEVDAILTATTLFKMKCGKAKEMENQKYNEMLEMLKELLKWSAHFPPAMNEELEKARELIKSATEL